MNGSHLPVTQEIIFDWATKSFNKAFFDVYFRVYLGDRDDFGVRTPFVDVVDSSVWDALSQLAVKI